MSIRNWFHPSKATTLLRWCMHRHTSGVALLMAVVLGLNFSSGAQADIIVTIDPTGFGRPGFGGTDVVDWGLLGPTRTVLSNPFNHTSNGGVNITVSQVGLEGFQRRDEGGNGWTGNFTDGFQLLWTDGRNGPVTIDFATAIQGVGFQIGPNLFATQTDVSVFGAGSVLLGDFNLTTNIGSDASASFLGFKSDLVDITSIEISQPEREDFAINQLTLITVPEPNAFALTALGLAGMCYRRRRRLPQSNHT